MPEANPVRVYSCRSVVFDAEGSPSLGELVEWKVVLPDGRVVGPMPEAVAQDVGHTLGRLFAKLEHLDRSFEEAVAERNAALESVRELARRIAAPPPLLVGDEALAELVEAQKLLLRKVFGGYHEPLDPDVALQLAVSSVNNARRP